MSAFTETVTDEEPEKAQSNLGLLVPAAVHQQKDFLNALTYLTVSIWTGGVILVSVWIALTILLLPTWPILSTISLATHVLLLLIPLDVKPPALVRSFMLFSFRSACRYFPLAMVYEDYDSLRPGRPYVVGYEPHSTLPTGISCFCSSAAELLPPGLKNTRMLVSSACFWAPVMRHLWWWLGCRPVSRKVASTLLRKGRSIVLCPGGVRECLYMHPSVETVFLRKRHGFVRLALEHGAPLVPVFAFGQTPQYGWVRLPFAARLARKIGWVPMLIWGAMGTPMPRKIPLKIVIGKAIEVPKLGVGNADPETVERYLKKFIEELEGIYERHKDDQGAVTHGGAVPPLMVY